MINHQSFSNLVLKLNETLATFMTSIQEQGNFA